MLLQSRIGLILCLCFQYKRWKTLKTFRWPMSPNMEVCFDRIFLMNNRTCKQHLKSFLFWLRLFEVSWRATPRHWTWIKHPKYQNRSISRFVDETRGKAFFLTPRGSQSTKHRSFLFFLKRRLFRFQAYYQRGCITVDIRKLPSGWKQFVFHVLLAEKLMK